MHECENVKSSVLSSGTLEMKSTGSRSRMNLERAPVEKGVT